MNVHLSNQFKAVSKMYTAVRKYVYTTNGRINIGASSCVLCVDSSQRLVMYR